MKRKISFILVGSLLLATPAWCLFDYETLSQLLVLVHQGATLYNLEQKAQRNVEDAIDFVKDPGGFRNVMNRASDAIGEATDGSRNQSARKLGAAVEASRAAINRSSGSRMSTENALRTAELLLSTAQAQQKLDQQKERDRYDQRYQQYAQNQGAFGCVSCSMGRLPK